MRGNLQQKKKRLIYIFNIIKVYFYQITFKILPNHIFPENLLQSSGQDLW